MGWSSKGMKRGITENNTRAEWKAGVVMWLEWHKHKGINNMRTRIRIRNADHSVSVSVSVNISITARDLYIVSTA
jgi:hypothetical protein